MYCCFHRTKNCSPWEKTDSEPSVSELHADDAKHELPLTLGGIEVAGCGMNHEMAGSGPVYEVGAEEKPGEIDGRELPAEIWGKELLEKG